MDSSIFTVLKKEILDAVRDKKTLFTVLIIPLVLYPILFFFVGNIGSDLNAELEESNKIAIVGNTDNALADYLAKSEKVTIIEISDIKTDIDNNVIYSAIEIPENFDQIINDGKALDIELYYDAKSQKSSASLNIVREIVNDFSSWVVANRISDVGLDEDFIKPIIVNRNDIDNNENSFAAVFIPMILPFLILISCYSSVMSVSMDLGAGEKERGTLESILITPVNRNSLIFGKILAITVLGLLFTLSMLVGLGISLVISPEFFGSDATNSIGFMISFESVIVILSAVLLISIMLGAVQLAVSFYSRSVKEAQSYLTFLMIIYYVPIFSLYTLDVKSLKPIHFHIPVANTMAIIKEAFAGIIDISHILTLYGWSVIYIVISIIVVRLLFKNENIIFRV